MAVRGVKWKCEIGGALDTSRLSPTMKRHLHYAIMSLLWAWKISWRLNGRYYLMGNGMTCERRDSRREWELFWRRGDGGGCDELSVADTKCMRIVRWCLFSSLLLFDKETLPSEPSLGNNLSLLKQKTTRLVPPSSGLSVESTLRDWHKSSTNG